MTTIENKKNIKTKTLPSSNPFYNFIKEIKKNSSMFILLLPGFLLVFVLCYMPMAGILLAFQKYRFVHKNFFINLLKLEWVSFDNFKLFFTDQYFAHALKNTIIYNTVFLLTGTIISLIIAIIINELLNRKIAKLYHSLMILPYFLSMIVFSYVVFAFLGQEHGFINNSILVPLGLKKIEWYMEPKYWPFILIIVNTIKHAAYGSILYLSAIVGLDPEYYELAMIYGASKWQQLTKITLPLISNVIIILIILNLGNILSADFAMFYSVPLHVPHLRSATRVLDVYIYELFRLALSDQIGKTTAAGLFKSIIGMITVLTSNLVVRKIDKEKALF
ncbi:MAG: ABC transporter permease subunit [Clostridiaceae bacterium]